MRLLACSCLFTFSAKCFKPFVPDWICADSVPAVWKSKQGKHNKVQTPQHAVSHNFLQTSLLKKTGGTVFLCLVLVVLSWCPAGQVQALLPTAFPAAFSSQTVLFSVTSLNPPFSILIYSLHPPHHTMLLQLSTNLYYIYVICSYVNSFSCLVSRSWGGEGQRPVSPYLFYYSDKERRYNL